MGESLLSGATAGGPQGASEDFSVFLGGPLYQMMRRARLSDDALRLVRRRIVVITLLAWLPLLVLTLVERQAFGGVAIPFIADAEVHVRFLVAVPLLVAAELLVHRRMRPIPQLFLDRNLIPEAALPRFRAALAGVLSLRNSVAAEVLLLAFVYGFGVLVIWRQYVAIDAATWYATPSSSGGRLSLAGIWFGYVSLPIFQFLLFRWYFRVFIWARFLWQVSRIPLNLLPMHPDRVGGLSFLSLSVQGFVVIAVAHGAMLAAYLADRILHTGAVLPGFVFEIAAVLAFVLLLALGPLLVFSTQLAASKRRGAIEYNTLAESYVRAFDTKWLRGGAPPGEELLGSGDIQSLTDLGSSLDVVKEMRAVPIVRADVLFLAVATLIPIAPLLLTMMPLDELLQKLMGVLF
jgi:hypothetical protein